MESYQFSFSNDKYLLESCKDLLSSNCDSDVSFISRENHEVKAHKLVLSLSCSFFKDLFSSLNETEALKIVLPNYSSEAVRAFVRFFYDGVVLITSSVAPEFASLCHEFNMSDEIPVIKTLIKNHKLKEVLDEPIVSIRISQVEVPKMEDSFDDYFQTNEHVETIFFNETDSEFPSDRDAEVKKTEENLKDEQYLNPDVQFLDDNPNFEQLEEADKAEMEGSTEKKDEIPQTPEFLENLELAAEDVRKGMSFWNAHRKWGVARGMILKHLQKKSEKKKLKKAVEIVQAPTLPSAPINIAQLRAEQDRFKKRLQEAINSVRDAGNPPKKAAKMFGVPCDFTFGSLLS